MSIAAVELVLKHSQARLGPRLVLISLANYANDQMESYPSVGTLALDSMLNARSVQYALRELEALGEIRSVGRRDGRYGTCIYQITISRGAKSAPLPKKAYSSRSGVQKVRGAKSAPLQGVQNPTQGVHPSSPEPSVLQPGSLVREPKGSLTAAPRKRDLVWDAQDAIFGPVTNDNERKRRARATKLYRQSLASSGIPEDEAEQAIRARRERYMQMWDHLSAPSDIALVNRWDQCKPTRTISSLPERRFT